MAAGPTFFTMAVFVGHVTLMQRRLAARAGRRRPRGRSAACFFERTKTATACELARREAEGLTLFVAGNKAGYFGVRHHKSTPAGLARSGSLMALLVGLSCFD